MGKGGILLAAAALALAGCVGRPPAQPLRPVRQSPERVEQVLAILTPWVDKALKAGPEYLWTELQMMDAAIHRGPDGVAASALFDEERKRLFRLRRHRIIADLRREVARMPDETLDDIMVMSLPGTKESRLGRLHKDGMLNWSIYDMAALQAAHDAAACEALRTTPLAWERRFPGRQPFDFERFGFDEDRLSLLLCVYGRKAW